MSEARHRLNRAIYVALAQAGVEIPFPPRAVRVTDAGSTEHGRTQQAPGETGASNPNC